MKNFGFLLLFALVAGVHGFIGMGINMYHPFCTYTCSSILSGSIYLECSEYGIADDGMSMKKRDETSLTLETSTNCMQTDPAYLSTVAWCYYEYCEDMGTTELEISWTNQNVSIEYSYEQALQLGNPNETMAADAEWLNYTMWMNPDVYHNNYDTYAYFSFQETMHARFGFSLLMVGWFFCGLGILYRVWQTFFPRTSMMPLKLSSLFHQHLLIPALIGKRADTPLPADIGYIPPRMVSLGIAIYFLLNLLFCAVPYHSVAGSTWYSTWRREIYAYVGNRTGVLSFANLPLLILFSSRNNLMMTLTGWSQTTFLHFHRWIAYICVSQAIAHSVVYTAAYLEDSGSAGLAAEAAQAYWWWGIIATIALSLTIPFAVLYIRRRWYETFLVLHYILAVLAVIGCWYHIKLRFTTEWGYMYWLYATIAVWSYDKLIRLVRIFVWNFASESAQVEIVTQNLLMITTYPSMTRGPGQYAYLYWPTISLPWTSHPFTVALSGSKASLLPILNSLPRPVQSNLSTSEKFTSESGIGTGSNTDMDIDNETNSSCNNHTFDFSDDRLVNVFFIKPQTGATLSLQSTASKAHIPVSVPIIVEGGYGDSAYGWHSADLIIGFFAGVGFSVGVSYLQHFMDIHGSSSKNKFVFAFTCRDLDTLLLVSGLVNSLKSTRQCVEIITVCTHEQDSARLDISGLVASNLESIYQSSIKSPLARARLVTVIACGPASFMDDTRDAVANAQKYRELGIHVDYCPESFSW
ncbi:ferric reductase like transmembrane component-domain-containing protein [Lipomyces oligophaga]|uniref:ferric reductase like transmembrane component-domain-containing protein n=1 Tax=Lipomyces oligophaga TaxID=45792 RepID=UPI0034CFB92C